MDKAEDLLIDWEDVEHCGRSGEEWVDVIREQSSGDITRSAVEKGHHYLGIDISNGKYITAAKRVDAILESQKVFGKGASIYIACILSITSHQSTSLSPIRELGS